ncbi:hypothetical protein O6H91_06G069400 [Diphasiastrum complanatum]|uniref:Uncharacterized protein n=1 Tax=Diphasiastrum complanatum TaxID=34168 RepID=A0ACC2DF50_DIPCM|nr:hypothetical protein O6H91_06G069400 [Diphasiastrum complanatum]
MDALAGIHKLQRTKALKNVSYEPFQCGQSRNFIARSEAHDEDNCSFDMAGGDNVEKEVERLCNILASSPNFLGIPATMWNAQQVLPKPRHVSNNTAIHTTQDCVPLPISSPDDLRLLRAPFSKINQDIRKDFERSSRSSTAYTVAPQPPLRSCLKRPPRRGAPKASPSKSVKFILNKTDNSHDSQMPQPGSHCKKSHPKHANEKSEDARARFAAKRRSHHMKGRSGKMTNPLSSHSSSDSSITSEKEGLPLRHTEFQTPVTLPEPAGEVAEDQVAERDGGSFACLPPPPPPPIPPSSRRATVSTKSSQQSFCPENSKKMGDRASAQEVSYDRHTVLYYQTGDKDNSQNSLKSEQSDKMAADSYHKSHHPSGAKHDTCSVGTGKSPPKQESTMSKKHAASTVSGVSSKKHSKQEIQSEVHDQKRPWKFWRKEDHLGSGSLATVYKGVSSTGTHFAVKEICLTDRKKASHRYILQLEQEIGNLCQLEHNNIVKYLGSESDENKIYIFLELITKGPLSELHEGIPFEYSQIRSFTRQILNGLKYLHDRNVAHRDLKCDNILMHENGTVKLADYGIAKQLRKLNPVNSRKGGAHWLAPEAKDPKAPCWLTSDIWSLGFTVLEMVTGSPPFPEMDKIIVKEQERSTTRRPLDELRWSFPRRW